MKRMKLKIIIVSLLDLLADKQEDMHWELLVVAWIDNKEISTMKMNLATPLKSVIW